MNNQKLLFDTSVQIDRFITKEVEKQLLDLSLKNDVYLSYYVIFEFKIGLIRSLIDFYLYVNITDASETFAKWSQFFKQREQKNSLILLSVMTKIYKTIETGDKKAYLAQIEATIFHLLNNFTFNMKIIGSFKTNSVVKFDILSKNNFEPFLKHIKKNKYIFQKNFWELHKKELDELVKNTNSFQKTDALKKIHAHLTTIQLI